MPSTYTLLAAAKINLYLEIIGSRPDGFHELVMIMQSVDLVDQLTISRVTAPTVRLHCDHPQVPTDASNLVLRAVALMSAKFPEVAGRQGGLDITLEKRIPVGAGLAGGSTNAAATLVGLNLLWGLGLSQIELMQLGAELGSDVPFCILGGTAIATGRGESLAPIPTLENLCAVLAKYESLSVSTPWAYQTYRAQFSETYISLQDPTTLAERQQRVHSGAIVSAIAHRDSAAIGQHLHNDLEKVVLPAHERVAQLRQVMANSGGLGTMMSGSGPTVFTLTPDLVEAQNLIEQVQQQLSDPDLKLWPTRFSSTGIRLSA